LEASVSFLVADRLWRYTNWRLAGGEARSSGKVKFECRGSREVIRESTGTIPVCAEHAPTLGNSLPNQLVLDAAGPGLLIGCGIAISAFLLRIDRLASVSFWFDEACAWRISSYPWSRMWESITRDAHPPGFYLLERAWRALWGNSVLAARSLSLCWGLASVAAGWWCAAEIQQDRSFACKTDSTSERFPLFAAMLLAWNALQIELSQEARPYEILCCLSLIAGACLLRALRRPRSIAAWTGFLLAMISLSFIHYYGLLMAAALFSFASVEILISWKTLKKEDKAGRQRCACQAAGLLLSLGIMQLCWLFWWQIFVWQLSRANAQLWLPPLTSERVIGLLWSLLAGGKASPVWGFWAILAPLVWLAVPLLLLRHGRGGRLAAICALVPVTLSCGYSLGVRSILEVRYLVAAQAYLLVGIAGLLCGMRASLLRRACIAVCLGWSLFWCLQQAEQRSEFSRFAGLSQACCYLNDQRSPDEPIITNSPFVDPTVRQAIRMPGPIRLQYDADPRLDLLGGPALLPEDISLRDVFQSSPQQVWTLEAEDLFGRDAPVTLPEGYLLLNEKHFTERFGIQMNLVVRLYGRISPPPSARRTLLGKQGSL
jgi:hypothetical protein